MNKILALFDLVKIYWLYRLVISFIQRLFYLRVINFSIDRIWKFTQFTINDVHCLVES